MSSFSPNSAQISNQTISAGSQTLSDHNALRADGVTVNGGVSFIAGQSIRLSNGFRATAGTASTTFHAWVQTLPVAVSVAPASGGGLSQTFTWTASSPSGWASLAEVYGLFNTSVYGVNGCYVRYDRVNNRLYLADNGASAWMGGFAPGSAQTVENSQCKIFGTGASWSGSGTQLAVTVPVEFKGGFAGTKTNYLQARDNIGQYTGWQAMGAWTVPGAQQYVLTTAVNPAGGGTVTPSCPGGCLYSSGTVVTATAAPNAGYQFTGFSGAISGSSPGTVTMNANKSVTANFSASPPNITGVSPTSGAVGTPVTITGTGFGGSGTVSFNGTAAQQIDSWSATTVVARVPAGATSGLVSLSTGGYQTSYQTQQFQVTSIGVTISPTSATLGTGQTQQFTATVTGTSNHQVTWSVTPTGAWGISAGGLFTAPGTITAPQTVTVRATSAAQPTAYGSATVTLTASPAISTLSLSQGPARMGLIISGANLGSQGTVTLVGLPGGDRVLTVINWSGTQITVQLPDSTPAGAGQVRVVTAGGATSNQLPFTVTSAFGCSFQD